MAGTPSYATEQDVYDESGLSTELVQRIADINSAAVTTLVNGFLCSAEKKVKNLLHLPHTVTREKHIGTGEDNEFSLGPEDEEFYIDYDPEDCVEMAFACFFYGKRKKKPYPKNCDDITDDKDLWDATGYTQPTDEGTIKQAGDFSMAFDWSGAVGIGRYPNVTNGVYIDKNIDIFDFLFLRLRSDTAGITVTINLHVDASNYMTATFTCALANKWYKAMLDLDDDFTQVGTVDWDDDLLMYITITVSDTCTLYVDNLNFNDDWCFTAPSGKLVIMHRSTDQPPAEGYKFYLTYTYDPFKVTTPQNIASATAQFAAVKLIDHLVGIRQSAIAFELRGEDMIPVPDKETLYHTRGSLLARAKENLASYGYGFTFAPTTEE